MVVDLRAALAEALDVQQGQQSSLTELTIRLEAAETASVEQQKDFLSRHDELVAKLEKSEETLKASRTEAAKTEWTLSELKSRLQVDELKLTDAAEQRSIIETLSGGAGRNHHGLEDTRRGAGATPLSSDTLVAGWRSNQTRSANLNHGVLPLNCAHRAEEAGDVQARDSSQFGEGRREDFPIGNN